MIDRRDFLRQRRSLIAISILLLFAEVSGIEIKEINILGNKVVVNNPQVVYVALWIALLYWFIRYYQHFRDLGDKGLKSSIYKKMAELVGKASFRRLLNDPNFHKKYEYEYEDNDERQWELRQHILVYKESLKQYQMRLVVIYASKGGSGTVEDEQVTVHFYELAIPGIRAIFYVLVHTHLFTEYVLPFILFLAPVTYKAYELFFPRS